MFLTKLSLNHFRCYQSLEQTFTQPTTIIDGDNGRGKTALIEAIYWQSTGRSFRHHKNINLIQHKENQLSVYSEYLTTSNQSIQKLGVSYSRNQQKTIKCNGELIRRQTDIAQRFPVIAIDPSSFLWIDHSPSFRRSYLDWLVFHVEPHYLPLWKQTQKVQQHINQLLRKGNTNELGLWQQKYCELAERTHSFRQQIVKRIQQRFKQLIPSFLPELKALRIDYKKGWSGDDLNSELITKQDYHLKQGYINVGVHKADLVCSINQQSAQVFLSRGQKKLIAVIMYLIFIDVFEEQQQQSPVICLDDIDSELDQHALQKLANYLQKKQRQLFITAVNGQVIQNYFNAYEVFHVKQDSDHNATLIS